MNRRPREPMRPPWPDRKVVLFEATAPEVAEAPPEGALVVPFVLVIDLRRRPLWLHPPGWARVRIVASGNAG